MNAYASPCPAPLRHSRHPVNVYGIDYTLHESLQTMIRFPYPTIPTSQVTPSVPYALYSTALSMKHGNPSRYPFVLPALSLPFRSGPGRLTAGPLPYTRESARIVMPRNRYINKRSFRITPGLLTTGHTPSYHPYI